MWGRSERGSAGEYVASRAWGGLGLGGRGGSRLRALSAAQHTLMGLQHNAPTPRAQVGVYSLVLGTLSTANYQLVRFLASQPGVLKRHGGWRTAVVERGKSKREGERE